MKHKADECGSIVVEASLSFVIFVAVLATIISTMNVLVIYDRVQYAMVQTVSEISSYTYLYSRGGIQAKHDKFKDKAAETKQGVEDLLAGMGELTANAGELGDQLSQGNIDLDQGKVVIDGAVDTADKVGGMMENPKATMQGFLAWGLDGLAEELKSGLLQMMAKPLMGKYLEFNLESVGGRKQTADEYLKSYGVKDGVNGLKMEQSKFLLDKKNIDLVVRYTVELRFAFIKMEVPVIQRVAMAAWMDGDGEKYE